MTAKVRQPMGLWGAYPGRERGAIERGRAYPGGRWRGANGALGAYPGQARGANGTLGA